MRFASVILPLAVPKTYTYSVPENMQETIAVGLRVEVELGKRKHYSAVVHDLHNEVPPYPTKEIIAILDESPIATKTQLDFWNWIANYYLCTLGEVMQAALPAAMKLSSETLIQLNPEYGDDFSSLDEKQFLIAERLLHVPGMDLIEVQNLLEQKSVYPIIQQMLELGVLMVEEQLSEEYKPREINVVKLADAFNNEDAIEELFEELKNAPKQTDVLMTYLQEVEDHGWIERPKLAEKSKTTSTIVNALVEKGFFELSKQVVSRLEVIGTDSSMPPELSPEQAKAKEEIDSSFKNKDISLLYGVTSSGKTLIYIHMIREMIAKGKQVLYLLPEIALTTQIISRLKGYFGDEIGVYHSRYNAQEKVEIWNKVLRNEFKLVIGARSSVFLPFQDLGLVIVDEEHDRSYKQFDPAPRYNARDIATYLATLFDAKVLLGTATPSFETWFNTEHDKYGLIRLDRRYGDVHMPKMELVSLREAAKKKKLKSHFTQDLLNGIEKSLDQNEQVILFQNRRGYAPVSMCQTCGFIPKCVNCDVSMTYHRAFDELKCHYCGSRQKPLTACTACGSPDIRIIGFGTEKIEEVLSVYIQGATIERMDLDTVRGKKGHERIINKFEDREIDILVGTQMVTKGLDFDHVSLVGILNADQLWSFPDFRAGERAFQLMVQVAGRAGRKDKQGRVMIQTYEPTNRLLQYVLNNDFIGLYETEMVERKNFSFPPFVRLIRITLKHRSAERVKNAAMDFTRLIRQDLGKRVLGPFIPSISRIRNQFIQEVVVKIERKPGILVRVHRSILDARGEIETGEQTKGVRVAVDVDPY